MWDGDSEALESAAGQMTPLKPSDAAVDIAIAEEVMMPLPPAPMPAIEPPQVITSEEEVPGITPNAAEIKAAKKMSVVQLREALRA